MPRKISADAFIASLRQQRTVAKPVAAEVWTYTDGNGRKRKAEVRVGKPQRVSNDASGAWCCPVYIGGWISHVVPAIGVGPLDALMNALRLVKEFREHIADMHISTDQGARRRKR
jgi:hypothetical protein